MRLQTVCFNSEKEEYLEKICQDLTRKLSNLKGAVASVVVFLCSGGSSEKPSEQELTQTTNRLSHYQKRSDAQVFA